MSICLQLYLPIYNACKQSEMHAPPYKLKAGGIPVGDMPHMWMEMNYYSVVSLILCLSFHRISEDFTKKSNKKFNESYQNYFQGERFTRKFPTLFSRFFLNSSSLRYAWNFFCKHNPAFLVKKNHQMILPRKNR